MRGSSASPIRKRRRSSRPKRTLHHGHWPELPHDGELPHEGRMDSKLLFRLDDSGLERKRRFSTTFQKCLSISTFCRWIFKYLLLGNCSSQHLISFVDRQVNLRIYSHEGIFRAFRDETPSIDAKVLRRRGCLRASRVLDSEGTVPPRRPANAKASSGSRSLVVCVVYQKGQAPRLVTRRASSIEVHGRLVFLQQERPPQASTILSNHRSPRESSFLVRAKSRLRRRPASIGFLTRLSSCVSPHFLLLSAGLPLCLLLAGPLS
jgi:hypothetical protein